jgi:hypothetical protein
VNGDISNNNKVSYAKRFRAALIQYVNNNTDGRCLCFCFWKAVIIYLHSNFITIYGLEKSTAARRRSLWVPYPRRVEDNIVIEGLAGFWWWNVRGDSSSPENGLAVCHCISGNVVPGKCHNREHVI